MALLRFKEAEDLPGPWSEGEAFGTATMVDGQLALKLSFSKKGEQLPVSIDVLEPAREQDNVMGTEEHTNEML